MDRYSCTTHYCLQRMTRYAQLAATVAPVLHSPAPKHGLDCHRRELKRAKYRVVILASYRVSVKALAVVRGLLGTLSLELFLEIVHLYPVIVVSFNPRTA
ncbi:hypothetical protein B296_00017922 [Ensete ventricosum]|uniref:Uncharacterized protein n=1 Tax=Ensete ventricosum TaxID=4639 RepID=A0A426Z6U1_ENSVE|nr:hypothetical protein B296_00017922 [Ensete ventricosum]